MVEGEGIVALARASVEAEVRGTGSPPIPDGLSDNAGAFVTLNTFPSRELRGCIGYPLPSMPLGTTIVEAGKAVCHDPRFPPLTERELDGVTVEVTVLTVPENLIFDTPDELLGMIEVGRDGLIIDYMGYRGLLLPQVPVEWGWDAEEYLRHLSMKAGLPPDAWRYSGVRISTFQGRIWHETTPNGDVVGVD